MPRDEKRPKRRDGWIVVGAASVLVLLVPFAVFGLWGWVVSNGLPPDAVQPFEFNHKIHIAADVDCLQCHEGLLDSSASPLPTLETCMGCHTDPPGKNRRLRQLAALGRRGRALHWDPLLRLPDHVFFSHGRHVEVANIQCRSCHSDMPQRTEPPRYRRIVTMHDCIACHQRHANRPSARRATLDCAACHR